MTGARRVLVTGAGGLVGRAVARRVFDDGWLLRACYHRSISGPSPAGETITNIDVAPETDWTPIVAGVDVVVHCAARVHVMRETAGDVLGSFRRINAGGTLALAQQAAAARVQRFVFLSSIHVNGNETLRRPFAVDDVPEPHSSYAVSKYEAELGLAALSSRSDMEVVIVRPPLVYGPGVGGNFERLLRILKRGVPLPFGAVQNRRSLIALSNLVDFVSTVCSHRQAANKTFLVSDGEDIATPELLRRTGLALGKPARLFSVPVTLLRAAAIFSGKQELARQLLGSLEVDIGPTREILGWTPPVRFDEALGEAARHFLAEKEKLA